MSVVNPGIKETYGDVRLAPDLSCFECGRSVHQNGAVRVAGGFWGGCPDIFLCAGCARGSDLHNLGALIGDAIVSNYAPQWADLQLQISRAMIRLERSVLRAVVIQLQFRLLQLQKS